MKNSEAQLDLFAPKPRRHDEARLMRRLLEVVEPPHPSGLTKAAIRRLMTPLPPITVPR